MNIALLSHETKRELLVQFCTAYAGVLSKHTLCAPAGTASAVSDATGLTILRFLDFAHGGSQQIGARISYNEIDLVLFLSDPAAPTMAEDISYFARLCDQNNVPFASNVATAEMLILGLDRGDLDWRSVLYPRRTVFTV